VYNITLICTAHREQGKCNVDELCKIFENISPEIIFEEIHPNRFDAYYEEKNVSTLETKAIIKYLHNHQIKHIPVDYYEVPDIIHFYKEVDYMNKIIFDNCDEYCLLSEERQSSLIQYGFGYLNGDIYSNLSRRLAFLEENVINRIDDENLSRIYKLWLEFNSNREDEMLKNIYNYSKEHCYNNAILIIGAEHKNSINKKIQEYKINEEILLNWKSWHIA
jgi:hypothetical protein